MDNNTQYMNAYDTPEDAAPTLAAPDEMPALPAAETASKQPEAANAPLALPPRESHTTTYVVLGCAIALVALSLVGSLLNVSDHLYALHPALGWAFWGLIAALVAVGIIVPVVKVASRPIFSLYQLRDERGRARQRHCAMLVNNLVANCDLTEDEKAQVKAYLNDGNNADDELIEFFNERIVPGMDESTKRAATTAFFVAALSHSPLISTVTMLSISLDLVRSIVEHCGFRPTNLGLARLYTRVMVSALIIGGLEDADLSDLISQILGGGAGARVGGLVIGSAAEGLVSAFLVFRVGVITKRWLTAADGPERMRTIRRASYREALAMMKEGDFMAMVTQTVKQIGSNVTSSVANYAVNSVNNAAQGFAERVVDGARSAGERARSIFAHD